MAPCVKVGLVWSEERSLDATKVEANAALVSLRTRFAVEAQLARLVATQDDEGNDRTGTPAKAADDAPVQMPLALTPQARSALSERAAQRHDVDRERRTTQLHRTEWSVPADGRFLHQRHRFRRDPAAAEGRAASRGLCEKLVQNCTG